MYGVCVYGSVGRSQSAKSLGSEGGHVTSITEAKTVPICGTNAEEQAGQDESCELGSPPAASHPFGQDFQRASECMLEVRGPPAPGGTPEG